ncbi:hypothetical protein C3489_05005 [Streptomyces sp. Ru71]|uniref:hypothetical protein n=1 Tax=Streptomyces sp. Ru71 TaxID=2080746 RepID=UPI000CDD8AD3|nr:hypothetical protein [Streptomyces sp. Ru71]POX56413.1 hypothetical protein C3489_05005 [Streptomyces sp. Ru71]
MNRPARLLTAALTVSAALLLTACGSGGGDSSSSDKIKGADTGGASSSPSPTAQQGGVKRPAITLPQGFEAEFQSWTNSDPKLQAILDDGREELRAEYAAVGEADVNSPAVAFYNSDATLPNTRKWIKQFVDHDETLIGKVTVFDPQVHISDSGSGVLFYCVDERKASTKERKSGKVTNTPNTPKHVLQYRTRLDKSAQGVWKLSSVNVVPGGCN